MNSTPIKHLLKKLNIKCYIIKYNIKYRIQKYFVFIKFKIISIQKSYKNKEVGQIYFYN